MSRSQNTLKSFAATAGVTALALSFGVGLGPSGVTPQASAATLCAESLAWGISPALFEHSKNVNVYAPASWSSGDEQFLFPIDQGSSTDNGNALTTQGTVLFEGLEETSQASTQLSNPQIRMTSDTHGELSFSATTVNAEGATIFNEELISFATLQFDGPAGSEGTAHVSATLTAIGSEALLGVQPSNSALDDLTLNLIPCETQNAAPSAQPTPDGNPTPGNADNAEGDTAPEEERASESSRSSSGSGSSRNSSRTNRSGSNRSDGESSRSDRNDKDDKDNKDDEDKKPKACYAAKETEVSWGVQEAFRALVKGDPNGTTNDSGSWDLSSQVKQQGGTFVFPGSQGVATPEAKTGTINGDGTVLFHNKKQKISVTFSNPQVRFNGTEGQLFATIMSEEKSGRLTDHGTIPVGNLSITNLKFEDNSVRGTAKVKATPEGAAALGGKITADAELDPIIFTAQLEDKAKEGTDDQPADCSVASNDKHYAAIADSTNDSSTVQFHDETPAAEPEVQAAALGVAGTNLKPWQLGVLSAVFAAAAAGTVFLTSRHPS